MPRLAPFPFKPVLAILLLVAGCDHGLVPPDVEPPGRIVGTVTYEGTWPPVDSVRDLRFVAMRFVPTDTTDFFKLNLMAISDRLAYGIPSDTFVIANVEPGIFFYSGIARQATESLVSWQPLGLVESNGGVFSVEPDRDTVVHVDVDFANPPVFPPGGDGPGP